MTQYYIDSDNGDDGADGLTPTGDAVNGPFATWNIFLESARSAGDICTMRRNRTANYDDTGGSAALSSGTSVAPITIEADYDDYWSDEVDLSGTATATLTFGSKTVTFSADVSSVVAVGDVIYASSDNNRLFGYEVAAVSTVTVTLYLPYKGKQAGSGKTMFNMGDLPKCGLSSSIWDAIMFQQDHHWLLQGFHMGSAGVCVKFDSAEGVTVRDCVTEGVNSGDKGFYYSDDWMKCDLFKCRTYKHVGAHSFEGFGGMHDAVIEDCLFDGNNVSAVAGIQMGTGATCKIDECEFDNNDMGDIGRGTSGFENLEGWTALTRNCLFLSASPNFHNMDAARNGTVLGFEDYQQTPGDSRRMDHLSLSETAFIYQSETTKVRGAGSPISIKIIPTVQIGDNDAGRLLIFEFDTYLTAAAHTITVYFASDDIAEWTTGPTAAELYLEVDYFGHSSNASRRRDQSSGTVDFTTDTDFDQTLAITFTPAQAGRGTIRLKYGKTKEAAKSNIFYVCPALDFA